MGGKHVTVSVSLCAHMPVYVKEQVRAVSKSVKVM